MRLLFVCFFSLLIFFVEAQSLETEKIELDTKPFSIDKKKRNILFGTQFGTYTIVLIGLDKLWYSDYPRSRFHFINDNLEWNQMDKLGHATASYYIGVAGIEAYKWTGMDSKKAIWYGGLSGSLFLTTIEILDGFSAEWGASVGDLFANTFGSALAITQGLAWDEQKIQLKYSYSPSRWAKLNPGLLGSSHLERALKDYNGQNYWLSFNIKSLFYITDDKFPEWLAFSIGHGSNKMLNAYPDNESINSNNSHVRQFLFSFDVDLNRIKTKSKFLNSILHTFGFLKFPMPTLEFRQGKVYSHLIYY